MQHHTVQECSIDWMVAGSALLRQGSCVAPGCRHGACLRDRPLRVPARRLPSSGVTCSAVVTDSAVPEGHKGLHGFLYGEKGADVHDNAERQYVLREVSSCNSGAQLDRELSACLLHTPGELGRLSVHG